MNALYFSLFVLSFSYVLAIALHGESPIFKAQNEKNSIKLFFVTLPALAFCFYFVALRPFNSGGDTEAYIRTYTAIQSIVSAYDTGVLFYGNTEYLFWPFQSVIKLLFDARGWLVVNFLIVALLVAFAYKKLLSSVAVSYLIFGLLFLTFYAVYSGNVMRQAYAIPLGMLAFHFAAQNKYLKFFIFSIMAVGFHWSAIIVVFAPLVRRLRGNKKTLFAIPVASLVISIFMVSLIGEIINAIGFSHLTVKYLLYFEGRDSHFGQVWQTVNFWVCVVVYALYLVFLDVRNDDQVVIARYFAFFMSLMLFSINVPDVSERYMAYFLFLFPVGVSIVLDGVRLPVMYKNIIYLSLFFVMAVLVYTRESTRLTLGIDL